MYSLFGVVPEDVWQVWRYVEPYIARSLDYNDGKYGLRDIQKSLIQELSQLWLILDEDQIAGVLVTDIVEYPRSKRVRLRYLAGEKVEEWLHLLGTIFDWARTQGCESAEVTGRPGWERLLTGFGFEKIHTVLRAQLSDSNNLP